MLFSLTKEKNTLGSKKNLGILSGLSYFLRACYWTKMPISSVVYNGEFDMFLHNKLDNVFLAHKCISGYFLCSQHNLGCMRKKPKKVPCCKSFLWDVMK